MKHHSSLTTAIALAIAILFAAGCGSDTNQPPLDSGTTDGSVPPDGSQPADGGQVTDSGHFYDGGQPTDGSGLPDSGPSDTGVQDTGNPDSGEKDTGIPDSGEQDTGIPDAGEQDAGTPDSGEQDSGTPDAGAPDANGPDAGVPDTGNPDAGTLAIGETCENAVSVVVSEGSPVIFTGQTTVGYANNYDHQGTAPAKCVANKGLDRVYSATVPAGKYLKVSVTPVTLGYDPNIYLVAGPSANCSANPLVCLAGDDSGTATYANTVTYPNNNPFPLQVFIIIDSYTSMDVGGVFTLEVSIGTPPAGDRCQTAPLIIGTDVTLTEQTTVGFLNDYSGGSKATCTNSDAGLDRVYSITVPIGKKLAATVTPEGGAGYNPIMYLIAGSAANCDAVPRTCPAVSSTSAGPNSLYWTNSSGSDSLAFIVIDSPSWTDTGGSFSLHTVISNPVAGDDCTTATPVTPGIFTGQTTVGFSNDYNITASCGARPSSGPDRVYMIAIPAGKILDVTVTPAGSSWDPAILLLGGPAEACGVSTCITGKDAKGAGWAETVSYTNTTGAVRTVYIVVDGYAADVADSFSLEVDLSDP
jgi:hypothetical protein